jgi:hypothetical protein
MNLREMITENPMRALAIAGALLATGLVIALFSHGPRNKSPGDGARLLFSVDDGKTWFADDASRIPPFDKNGKQAVLARVYRCSNGTEFVNHLERFTPAAKQVLERASAPDPSGKTRPDRSAIQSAYTSGREVKRPGDANWVSSGNLRDAAKVTTVKCPNGGTAVVPVQP